MAESVDPLENYLHRVEHRATSRFSPYEAIERDTLQRGISYFETNHGPFDSVTVEDHGEFGWKLIGKRDGQRDLYAPVAKPMTIQRVDDWRQG